MEKIVLGARRPDHFLILKSYPSLSLHPLQAAGQHPFPDTSVNNKLKLCCLKKKYKLYNLLHRGLITRHSFNAYNNLLN